MHHISVFTLIKVIGLALKCFIYAIDVFYWWYDINIKSKTFSTAYQNKMISHCLANKSLLYTKAISFFFIHYGALCKKFEPINRIHSHLNHRREFIFTICFFPAATHAKILSTVIDFNEYNDHNYIILYVSFSVN